MGRERMLFDNNIGERVIIRVEIPAVLSLLLSNMESIPLLSYAKY